MFGTGQKKITEEVGRIHGVTLKIATESLVSRAFSCVTPRGSYLTDNIPQSRIQDFGSFALVWIHIYFDRYARMVTRPKQRPRLMGHSQYCIFDGTIDHLLIQPGMRSRSPHISLNPELEPEPRLMSPLHLQWGRGRSRR